MKRVFLFIVIAVCMFSLSGLVTDAKTVHHVKKKISHVVSKKKAVNKKIKGPPHASVKNAPRGDTFAQFFYSQSAKKQQCIRRSFTASEMKQWLSDSNATLKLPQIKKVSRCIGHYLEY